MIYGYGREVATLSSNRKYPATKQEVPRSMLPNWRRRRKDEENSREKSIFHEDQNKEKCYA